MRTIAYRIWLCALLCCGLCHGLNADLYNPNRPLYRLDTEHFSFIFPEESREAASFLAAVADDAYRQICAFIGQPRLFRRLPVVITPDPQVLNGYFSNYPYNRIVLYQAASDPNSELGALVHDLYQVFYHELTHAVSLSLRGPIQTALAAVLGDPLSLSLVKTPMNLVEGITVATEGQGGGGRTKDPYIAARLRQDLLDGQWKSFWQSSGAYDLWPGAALYYHYGGFFSAYLLERFGEAAYRRLWERLSSDNIFQPLHSGWLGKGSFELVYGHSLSGLWDDFAASLRLSLPVLPHVDALRSKAVYTALAADPDADLLFYALAYEQALYSYNLASGQEVRIQGLGLGVERIDRLKAAWAGSDGKRPLLLSTQRLVAGMPRLELRSLDPDSGRHHALPWEGLRDAAWASADSIVAIQVDGYMTNLVLADSHGIRLILAGTDRISFSRPVLAEDGRVYFLARVEGRNRLWRVQPQPLTEVSGLPPVEELELPQELPWLRYLSLSGSWLFSSWDDQNLSRLLAVDLVAQEVHWQNLPITGGIHHPVGAGSPSSGLYYLAYRSDGQELARFPADEPKLDLASQPARWLAVDLEYPDPPVGPEAFSLRPYRAAPWLLPRYWHPNLGIDSTVEAGASLYFADPIERISGSLTANWNWTTESPFLSLRLDYSAGSSLFQLELSDQFSRLDEYAGADSPLLRDSSAILMVGDQRLSFSGLRYGWQLFAYLRGQDFIEATAPLYEGWEAALFGLGGSLGLGRFSRPYNDPEGIRGFQSSLGLSVHRQFLPQAYQPLLRVQQGAYLGMHPLAAQLGLFSSFEHEPGLAGLGWQGHADLSLRLLGAELQHGFGGLYWNRLQLRLGGVIDAGVGDVFGEEGLLYSGYLYANFRLIWSPLVGRLSAHLRPYTNLELRYHPDLGAFSLSFSLVSLPASQ